MRRCDRDVSTLPHRTRFIQSDLATFQVRLKLRWKRVQSGRESRGAARQLRARGLVASEYLSAAREARPWWDAAVGDERFARNAAGLATDYWELTCEILTRLRHLLIAEPLVPLTFS